MRLLLVLVVTAGCYDPTPAIGVRCGTDDACPAELACLGERCVPPGTVNDATPDVPPPPPPIDAPPPPMLFVDSFDRPDGDTLGNGWIEKTPATFSLRSQAVARVLSTSYRNNLVYRPASEDLRDVELSIVMRPMTVPVGSPQIFVRAQASTIATSNTYDGYLMYVSGGSDDVVIGRQLGAVFVVELTRFTVAPAFDTTSTYRMTLRAVGESPVSLRGSVERMTPTGWTLVGTASVDDTAANRITGAGSVGFSGSTDDPGYTYDDVTRTPL